MSLLIGFDASKIEEQSFQQEPPVLPPGQYRMVLAKVDEDESRNTGTFYVRWNWTVIAGKHENTMIECLHFPYSGKDPDLSMKIFQGHTKSLCRALELSGVSDYNDMLNKPVIANVKYKEYRDKYGDLQKTNFIRSFSKDTGGQSPAKPVSSAKSSPPPPDLTLNASNQPTDFDDDIPF